MGVQRTAVAGEDRNRKERQEKKGARPKNKDKDKGIGLGTSIANIRLRPLYAKQTRRPWQLVNDPLQRTRFPPLPRTTVGGSKLLDAVMDEAPV